MMRDLYILAVGVVLGVHLVEWLQRTEERIAWRAGDRATDELERRRRWSPPHVEPAAETSEASAA